MSPDYFEGRAVLPNSDLLHHLINHYHFRVYALQVTSRQLEH